MGREASNYVMLLSISDRGCDDVGGIGQIIAENRLSGTTKHRVEN